MYIDIDATEGLICWICGDTALPYNTNPEERNSIGAGSTSWCQNTVTSAACIPEKPGQELFCYKETWTVDGMTMVKRGVCQ